MDEDFLDPGPGPSRQLKQKQRDVSSDNFVQEQRSIRSRSEDVKVSKRKKSRESFF